MATEQMATEEKTVFVVDDDPGARDSVSALAQSAGYATESFASAESFLERYNRNRPGCLIADIRMIEMSGLELQDRLVSEDCPLPVIIISAYANAPLAVKAMQLGAVNVLEKPCSNTELLESVHHAMDLDTERRKKQAEVKELRARLATLTDDEQAVLTAIIAGKANKIIARELCIGLRTVEARRHNVFEKMQADSLAELVKIMVAIGERGD